MEGFAGLLGVNLVPRLIIKGLIFQIFGLGNYLQGEGWLTGVLQR